MTTHITRLLKELENIATANYKKWSVPHATAADFVTWAQSRATFAINEVNAAIAQEKAEQATQDQFITADAARALGMGNAEWFNPLQMKWIVCGQNCQMKDIYQYRAIRKEVPAEPTVLRTDFDHCMQDKQRAVKLIEETYELIFEGRLQDAKELLEKRVNNLTVHIPPFIETAEPHAELRAMHADHDYRCAPKADLIKLDGKLVTREAAIAIWASKKDTCDMYYQSNHFKGFDILDTFTGTGRFDWNTHATENAEYQLRPKAKKPVRLDPAIRDGVIALLQELNFIK